MMAIRTKTPLVICSTMRDLELLSGPQFQRHGSLVLGARRSIFPTVTNVLESSHEDDGSFL